MDPKTLNPLARWTPTDACVPVGGLCVPPPTVSCIPPLLWHTDRCECPDGSLPTYVGTTPQCLAPPPPPPPPPPVICAVTISYSQGTPTMPQVSAVDPSCDGAGVELAIAIILARMLGAP